jgi:hypothetical protein
MSLGYRKDVSIYFPHSSTLDITGSGINKLNRTFVTYVKELKSGSNDLGLIQQAEK